MAEDNLLSDHLLESREVDSIDQSEITGALLFLYDPSAPAGKRAVPITPSRPLPVVGVGGVGGAAADPDSAREETLQGVFTHTQAVNGNTYILANQANKEGLHVLLPQVLRCAAETFTVGAAARGLPNMDGYNEATIHVVSGTVRRCVGGAASAQTPPMGAGDSEELEGHELIAYSLVSADGQDAQLCAEYRQREHPVEQPGVEFY